MQDGALERRFVGDPVGLDEGISLGDSDGFADGKLEGL